MMRNAVYSLARLLWPGVDRLNRLERETGVGNVFGAAYAFPLAAFGFLWLLWRTDLDDVRAYWALMLFFLGVSFVLSRLNFFMITEIKTGIFADVQGSLDGIVVLSAILVLGPVAVWLDALAQIALFLYSWTERRTGVRWQRRRNFLMEFAVSTCGNLVAVGVYTELGGVHPFPGLVWPEAGAALAFVAVRLLMSFLVYLPLMTFWSTSSVLGGTSAATTAFFNFFLSMQSWPLLVYPFALLAAMLYTETGFGGYLFMMLGLVQTSVITHRLSIAVDRNRRRSIELEKLEALGRALLDAPPDSSALRQVLRENVSGMFMYTLIEIRLLPEDTLLKLPEAHSGMPEGLWRWLSDNPRVHYFRPGTRPPWQRYDDYDRNAIIIVPIFDAEESSKLLGGVALLVREPLIQHDAAAASNLLPAAQSLSAQIASALHRADVYRRTLAHQRTEQELALAGQIQATFIPDSLPQVAGWSLTALLEPARQTSGDFYDVIPLAGGRLGILVADVADKGMGAALFMAISRTLIRLYAQQHPDDPAQTLYAANCHIMEDTRTDLFVTVFYGVLDPATGLFTYSNAGHNPAYLLPAADLPPHPLKRTGVPLGLFDKLTWGQERIQLDPGDVLILYTDGLTEAQRGEMWFGEDRLLRVLREQRGKSGQRVHRALTREVFHFMRGEPLVDDLTLVVLGREAAQGAAQQAGGESHPAAPESDEG